MIFSHHDIPRMDFLTLHFTWTINIYQLLEQELLEHRRKYFQKQPPELFCKKYVQHLRQSLFFIKVTGLRLKM